MNIAVGATGSVVATCRDVACMLMSCDSHGSLAISPCYGIYHYCHHVRIDCSAMLALMPQVVCTNVGYDTYVYCMIVGFNTLIPASTAS